MSNQQFLTGGLLYDFAAYPGTIMSGGPLALGSLILAVGIGANDASAVWPSANRAIYIPFRVPEPDTAKQMYWLNGATVSGNVDVGIYDLAGNRLVSSGSVAQSGVSSIQIADITDTSLIPGNYFMVMAVDNVTATFDRWNPAAILLQVHGAQRQDAAFTLPATATFANPANAYVPVMGVAMGSVL